MVEIVRFEASPPVIAPGESTILSWSLRHADSAQLFGAEDQLLAGSAHTEDSVTDLIDDGEGRRVVIQWDHAYSWWADVADLNFQVVLWANGAFDLRYGSMTANYDVADGEFVTIGFQDTSLTHAHMLNAPSSLVSGGLRNRSWRYFERPQASAGSETFTLDETTIFTLCVTLPTEHVCEQKTVQVN